MTGQKVTLTITMTVDKEEYDRFLADHAETSPMLYSFDARLQEVFGPTEVLTTGEVTDLKVWEQVS